jgi:hypothetical protein
LYFLKIGGNLISNSMSFFSLASNYV